jgi:hypothetical protein
MMALDTNMERARRAAVAYAVEHNLCVGAPYGCGEVVAPVILTNTKDLRVLVSTAAGGDGPQIEAQGFPTADAYQIWLVSGLCWDCQRQSVIRCSRG